MAERDRDEGVAEQRIEPADLFAAVTLVGVVAMTVARSWAGAMFLTLTFGAILLLRRLELPTTFEFGGAVAIVLTGWGNALTLFQQVGPYDKAVHFLTPMLIAPCLCFLLVRWGALPAPNATRLERHGVGIFAVTTALGFALAGAWEVVEGSADRWLGTNLAFGHAETIDDLYSSLLGSVAGGVILAWSALYGERALEAASTTGAPPEALDEGG